MIIHETCYCYSDLQIVPETLSNIRHRSECNPYDEKGNLPIFTAPMDSVADDKNYHVFEQNGIIPIIHRNVSLEKRLELTKQGKWCAYRLSEVEKYFNDIDSELYKSDVKELKCLIDIANGHMLYMYELALSIKNVAKKANVKLETMAGNIANPRTYELCCNAEIDYVRCSIGTGSLCLTSSNTACGGYPNATLIDEIVQNVKPECSFKTKIIADGGIRNYSDAIVALALGADYVMIGGLFSKFIESCGEYVHELMNQETISHLNKIGKYGIYVNSSTDYNLTTYHQFMFKSTLNLKFDYDLMSHRYGLNSYSSVYNSINADLFTIEVTTEEILKHDELKDWLLKNAVIKKHVHGMSSKKAQMDSFECQNIDKKDQKFKTSEGKESIVEVNTTCHKWTDNFISYLQSAMSYTNCRTLKEFTSGELELVVRSAGTQLTVNK